MLIQILLTFLSTAQSLGSNDTSSKLILGAAGIVSMLAMLKTMRRNAKSAKQKMTKAQRKEMRKMKWRMQWMMLKKLFSSRAKGDGTGRLIILLIIYIGALIGLYIIAGWWLPALILLLSIIYYNKVNS